MPATKFFIHAILFAISLLPVVTTRTKMRRRPPSPPRYFATRAYAGLLPRSHALARDRLFARPRVGRRLAPSHAFDIVSKALARHRREAAQRAAPKAGSGNKYPKRRTLPPSGRLGRLWRSAAVSTLSIVARATRCTSCKRSAPAGRKTASAEQKRNRQRGGTR